MGERLAPHEIAPRGKLLTRAECRFSENDTGCSFEKLRNGSAADEHIGLAVRRYEIACRKKRTPCVARNLPMRRDFVL
ncbi:MAG: hypothetical protein HRU71_03450 [Planctomycetia bacterium]|nr:MAG: hypothetical protein HRU71_03450 [Planctomycetia bacterium]RIK69816.1 MAG: hypothetical protein DCC66_07120 [Planctomycetota bacterium]